jgi:DNA modification methylase
MTGPFFAEHDVTLYQGHVLDVLPTLEPESVNCVVTSPPYYGLRDYGVEGQIGLEASPSEYVETMRAVFAEVRRVLRPDGVLWLNLGDSYAGSWGNQGHDPERDDLHVGVRGRGALPTGSRTGSRKPGEPGPKNLYGLPWRVAFALQDDGWTLRAEVIWSKRNCMPESVTDRPSRSHEQVFLFSKSPRYWYNAEAIREDSDPEQVAHNERYAKPYAAFDERAAASGKPGARNSVGIHSRPGKPGRNARTVWTISTQPYSAAHFATFPPELARRCITAGCPADGTVFDPFTGSGTTLMVARRLLRKSIGIELNPAYCELTVDRIGQPIFDFGEATA